MAEGRRTFLFGEGRIATAAAGMGAFGHSFGGPHDRKGAAREDCGGILIHLLHRLDLADPAVPIAIPGVRWLPLYYCFDFRANDLGYRLISDDRLVTYFPEDDPNVTAEEEWPDGDYPAEFPRSPIDVASHPYDPTDADDALRWSGIFGIGQLTPDDRESVRRRLSDHLESIGFDAPETEEEFEEALSHPFLQGKPDSPCLNPECPDRHHKGRLVPIALMPAEPIPGLHLYGRWESGVRLIFRICPRCSTIRASNECG